jgi:CRP/FNR family cyclic AMP-dependent transcriptional regulator
MISNNLLRAMGAELLSVPESGKIISEGEIGMYYYQLVSGTVKWSNESPCGREIIQEIIIQGEPIAAFTLFDGLPSVATASAMENSEVLRLPKQEFDNLLEKRPELYPMFTKYFVRRLRYKFLALKEFTNSTPVHRIRVLFDYFKMSGRNYCTHCSRVKLTRQQISFITGLRIETVIRTIRNLAIDQEVFIVRGKIYLNSPQESMMACSHPVVHSEFEFLEPTSFEVA